MKLLPIVMVRNEEKWIKRVLEPLISVFPHVIVGDTHSTDSTVEILSRMSNIFLEQTFNSSPQTVGLFRGRLQEIAKDFGATHVLQVDGDELYTVKSLQLILDNPMPETCIGGYTMGVEVIEQEEEFWFMNCKFHRLAVYPVYSKWSGAYPYESPDTYHPTEAPVNHYYPCEQPHYYHLHHCTRSSRDEEVFMRVEKRNKFSMQEHPELHAETLWLKSFKDYPNATTL